MGLTNIKINLDAYKYCYLNNIYKNDRVAVFELVMANNLFTECVVYSVDAQMLVEIVKNENLVKDFDIVEGLLKCSTVKITTARNDIEKSIGSIKSLNLDQHSFYSLIRDGANGKYILLDKEALNMTENSYVGSGVGSFLDIKISDSTMSAYARINTEDGIYNKMLITMEEGNIHFHPFYFGVPINQEECEMVSENSLQSMDLFNQETSISDNIVQKYDGVKYIGEKTINEQWYKVYYAEFLQLYTRVFLINSFINKAVSMHNKYLNLLTALQFFITEQYSVLDKKQETPKWVGGKTNYKDDIGVYFKSSRDKLSKSKIEELYDFLISVINRVGKPEEVKKCIEGSGYNRDEKDVILMFYNLFLVTVDPTELLSLAFEQKKMIEVKNLFISLFLYEIRLNAYNSNLEFRSDNSSLLLPIILAGSDERSYTVVNKISKNVV